MKIFSQTSCNIIESSKRIGGGETTVVMIWGQVWLEELGVSMIEVSEIGWKGAIYGGSWMDYRTKGEDELNGWFKNPGLNHWLACSSSTLETDVIIKSGPVEFSCEGWDSYVASEGKATFRGWGSIAAPKSKAGRATMIWGSTNVWSSDTKVLALESDCSGNWDSCWIWIGESGLSSDCCCWGFSK